MYVLFLFSCHCDSLLGILSIVRFSDMHILKHHLQKQNLLVVFGSAVIWRHFVPVEIVALYFEVCSDK